ncbi:hypothetical protein ACRRTK_005234 [Alexandromys fortis]
MPELPSELLPCSLAKIFKECLPCDCAWEKDLKGFPMSSEEEFAVVNRGDSQLILIFCTDRSKCEHEKFKI